MSAVCARHRVINAVTGLSRLLAAGFVYVGAGGQNQRGDMFRIGGGDLNRNGGAGMVADDRRALPRRGSASDVLIQRQRNCSQPGAGGIEHRVGDRGWDCTRGRLPSAPRWRLRMIE